jgi:predicted alpha-1,2-mannosidase
MANEPSLHIPYLYNYAGAPWKTQKRIRQMLDTWFRGDLMGIPGDEDGGGLSSFVVFSSLGFYPVTPGSDKYALGSPVFEEASIALPGGKTFRIIAEGCSNTNKYIVSATLNGTALDGPFITHGDILSGGTLRLVMSDKPAL